MGCRSGDRAVVGSARSGAVAVTGGAEAAALTAGAEAAVSAGAGKDCSEIC